MVYTLEIPNPGFCNKATDLFPLEDMHATSLKNLDDLNPRRDAVDFILKVKQDCNLNSKLTYLAINYIDRYLNKRPFEQVQAAELIGTACLSLAAKTLGLDAFSAANLKEENRFKRLDAEALRSTELEVSVWLGLDLNSITPFAFLRFLAYYMSSSDDFSRFDDIQARASEILIQVQPAHEGILEHKASVIAVAALFCAVEELFPQKFRAYVKDVYSCELVDKARVEELYPDMKAALESIKQTDKKRPIVGSSKDDGAATKKRLAGDDDVNMEKI